MAEHRDHQASFSDVESEDLAQYKRVSLLAVASVVTGVLSVATLLLPFTWWLPLLTIALALASLLVISKQQDVLLGRRAAVIGLCLGLLFGTWALANHSARQQFLYRDARPHCERWLQLVLEGELFEAHQLQQGQSERRAPGTDLADLYAGEGGMVEMFKTFSQMDYIRELQDIGPAGKIRLVSDDSVSLEYRGAIRSEVVAQTYAVDYEQDGQPSSMLMSLRIERRRDSDTGEIRWHLRSADRPLPSSD